MLRLSLAASIGGSSPSANIYPTSVPIPRAKVITQGIANGRDNTLPSFITATGPSREARFPFFFNSNGSVNTNSPNGVSKTCSPSPAVQTPEAATFRSPVLLPLSRRTTSSSAFPLRSLEQAWLKTLTTQPCWPFKRRTPTRSSPL